MYTDLHRPVNWTIHRCQMTLLYYTKEPEQWITKCQIVCCQRRCKTIPRAEYFYHSKYVISSQLNRFSIVLNLFHGTILDKIHTSTLMNRWISFYSTPAVHQDLYFQTCLVPWGGGGIAILIVRWASEANNIHLLRGTKTNFWLCLTVIETKRLDKLRRQVRRSKISV